jgi:hypothetical protein
VNRNQLGSLVLATVVATLSGAALAQTSSSAPTMSSAKYQLFKAKPSHRKATKKPHVKALAHAFSNPYALLLINETDHVIRMVSVDGGTHTAATQLIGRTCSYPDVNQCFKEQKWGPLATVNCGSTVDLVIYFQENNKWFQVQFDRAATDCNHPGGVFAFVP